MKTKDSNCDNHNSTINSNKNPIGSPSFNKNNILNNNSTHINSSVYELDKNILIDENLQRIQKNYIEYYSKNMNDLEHYNFYHEILDSINFENKEPEIKDILVIDKLFGLNSDENPNINTTNMNDSVKLDLNHQTINLI